MYGNTNLTRNASVSVPQPRYKSFPAWRRRTFPWKSGAGSYGLWPATQWLMVIHGAIHGKYYGDGAKLCEFKGLFLQRKMALRVYRHYNSGLMGRNIVNQQDVLMKYTKHFNFNWIKYLCMHVYMHVCMHVCMYVCTYVCIYIHIYIYILHIYIYITYLYIHIYLQLPELQKM